jgi:hypothetical protein
LHLFSSSNAAIKSVTSAVSFPSDEFFFDPNGTPP